MKYYVTGVCGFIGQVVCKYIEENFPGIPIIKVDHPITKIKIDDNPFEFIHLSAYGNHYFQKDVSQLLKANVQDLVFILDLIKDKPCRKFYNISTSSIQLPEQTIYSASKLLGEQIVNSCENPNYVNVRPFSVYGPGEAPHRFIPTVIRAINAGLTIQLDPFSVHDWIYVDDFVDAMFKGYTNIGSSIQYKNIELVEFLQEISGKKLSYQLSKLRGYDTEEWYCKDRVPSRPLFDGLRQTYEFFTQKNN